jgi:hypothetical protein
MLAADPHQGGATWAVLQYVLGLRRLGHDVLLVEPTTEDRLADPVVVRYFGDVARRFHIEDRAVLVAGGAAVGSSHADIADFARGADVLFNISGMLKDPALLEPVPVRVYLDLDPTFIQLWHAVEKIDMHFDGHTHFVTVGLAIGTPACDVPTCGRSWITTLPPVVLEEWPLVGEVGLDAFTTVGNWRGYGSIRDGDRFYGQKAHSFRTLLPLPQMSGERFAPALAIDAGEHDDVDALREFGWELRDPAKDAGTPDAFQRFVQSSRAELGVAKSGYVTSRCGWFSDRSAAYLASGRPVLAQETGFSDHLPVGEGLLAFSDLDGAVEGVASVWRRYEHHARAARALAESCFASDLVLGRLLEAVAT